MLDGLLGRGFAAKWSAPLFSRVLYFLFVDFCYVMWKHGGNNSFLNSNSVFIFSKPLIKLTKSRIEVTRRKRRATEKFLKKDIADLLFNGLDINAYGRVIFSYFFKFLFSECSLLWIRLC